MNSACTPTTTIKIIHATPIGPLKIGGTNAWGRIAGGEGQKTKPSQWR